jgi:hypothetical protein
MPDTMWKCVIASSIALVLAFIVGHKPRSTSRAGAQQPERAHTSKAASLKPARTYELSAAQMRQLPQIGQFLAQPSDRFLIDWNDLRGGHPYKGRQIEDPHTGCHVTFRAPRMPLDPRRVEEFPAIYAVADGFITRIDEAFRLQTTPAPGAEKPLLHVRYGVDLAFAVNAGQPVLFHYSIEPMVDPGDASFYAPFIKVKPGQRVKKGDVLARMYLPEDARALQGAHIHFNLIWGRQFQSPSIFNEEIAGRFQECWTDEDRRRFPPAMGQGLYAEENPFGTGAQESL